MLLFTPFIILKIYADYFLVTAGVPKLGLVVPSIIGIIHFSKKSSTIHFVKTKFNFNVIKESCINGSSEMVTQSATSVTTFLYNIVIIKFLGADGVASITIILYIQFLLNSVYLGFTSGAAPRISYNYGSKNEEEINKLVKYSFLIILVFAISSFILSRTFSNVLIGIFVDPNSDLFNITLNGFKIFSFGFLFAGINIFTTGMFTAFSNGKISAMLSLCRTFILFIIGIVVLPKIFGLNGVWLVVPIAELVALIISMTCVYINKEKYLYSKIFKKDNKVIIEN
ncbi:MAG: MATE family efflux transporter [Peptostreptococcaceae bacterium]